MHTKNLGFNLEKLEEYRNKMKASGHNFIFIDEEDNTDEYVHFNFIGMYEGHQVIYDAVMYTLRLHHNSELYEIAEHKAAQRFPEFKAIKYEEDENGDLALLDDVQEEIGLFMAETIVELEDEEAVKVSEHVEVDPLLEFGIGLDVGLHIEKIDNAVIENFIKDYNEDNIKLDTTLYTFEAEDFEMN